MKNKNLLLIIISILIFSQLLFFKNSYAERIENFIIEGNERVSKETIIMFSNLKIGDDINDNILNNALKELYYTDYFKNVIISKNKSVIIIKVNENPIIQSVVIKGAEKNSIYEKLTEVTKKIEKYPFVENKINDQVTLLNNILKSNGYYFVKIKTTILQNDNNTIDLVHDIDLGDVAKIKKITFIGDKVFRDNTLRNVIISEESKFWKFLTSNKFLDSNRINADVIRLNNFYKNRGFFNVKIKSTTAIITDEDQFELIFNINSGKKYYFNNIQISNLNKIPLENIEFFQKKFKDLNGKKYSRKILTNLIDEFNNSILRDDFIFVNAQYNQIIKDENLIDVNIILDEIDKKFVERINVFGNFITDEKVIRNTLIIDEGDPFNDILFNRSISKIKAKNIFKSVNYNTTEIENSKKIVDIIVEEKATGEIFAGAGTGTTGNSINAGIKENNYLGLGIKLDTDVTITEDSIKGSFSVLNPNYNNSDKSISTTIESSANDFMSQSGYKTNRTGFVIGTEFEQKNDLFINLELSNYYEDLETSSSATDIVKKQEGNYIENLLSYTITFNRLDQDFQPSDGFVNNFSQTLPIYSEDKAIENKLTGSIYHSISNNVILSASYYLKTINSLEDNVRISKRVYVPGRRLRGFESGKIGPKDGSQYIGGNYATALNLNTTLPNVLFENDSIDLNFFIDMANVWEVDYNSNLDSNKVRSSTGIAVNWFSTIGPLTFSYAIPLTEEKTDITENFRFQIGTSF